MSLSIVLLIATHPFYEANSTSRDSSHSVISFIRTRKFDERSRRNAIWRKIMTTSELNEYPNERRNNTDWIPGTHIPMILDHWRTFIYICCNITPAQTKNSGILSNVNNRMDFRNGVFSVESVGNNVTSLLSWIYYVLSTLLDVVPP